MRHVLLMSFLTITLAFNSNVAARWEALSPPTCSNTIKKTTTNSFAQTNNHNNTKHQQTTNVMRQIYRERINST